MSSPLRTCSLCSQPFWSTEPLAEVVTCPGCIAVSRSTTTGPPVGVQPGEPQQPRFVSLSALPPEKRVPPRENGTRPGLMVPRRLGQMSGSAPQESLGQEPVSALPNLLQERRLGFNCPSCFVVLIIKAPDQYDGRAAPCPSCGIAILPPRLAPHSPFTLVMPPEGSGNPIPACSKLPRQPRAFGRHNEVHAPESHVA